MKILLLGYGKMGKEIDKISSNRGHEVVGKVDKDNQSTLTVWNSKNVDIAIEFSEPGSAFSNIQYCLNSGIPIVSGTTGWLSRMKEVTDLCNKSNGTFFYASNYSIGVNLFFQLNKQLAKMMDNQKGYGISIEEIHHTEKKDSPSGTAITLAEGIVENSSRYESWVLDKGSENKISITALREDPAPGTHTVKYSSDIDDIEIKHTAHSRQGFATGAVMVAEWVVNKKGMLGMSNFLKELKNS